MANKEYLKTKPIEDIIKLAVSETSETNLKKNLTVVDLTALGIAALVGAGIFSTIGEAAVKGGPAVSLLFVFTAIACGFSALCYARFASILPISGSAYTYSYATFGELIAWIIGWDLILEYAIGNIAMAISWSDYFSSFVHGFGIHIPEYLATNYTTAYNSFLEYTQLIASGTGISNIPAAIKNGYMAWTQAPSVLGIKIILDIPAMAIVAFLTYLVYVGIKESKNANNLMVGLKITILLVVISVGIFYINSDNWSPFAPNGAGGVLKSVSAVFFAYIGIDAMTTTSEECKNAQRDLPRSIIATLIIATILYVILSIVLTGMVNYKELGVGDPLSYVFEKLGLSWLSGVIGFGALIAMASVLLVFQIGQPRIWMSMSRDGLLPPKFSKLHKKHKTPAFATIITGLLVGIPVLFCPLSVALDFCSIGTLFALVLVSAGILILDNRDDNIIEAQTKGRKVFKIPYWNCRYIMPPLVIIVLAVLFYLNHEGVKDFFTLHNPLKPNVTKLEYLFEELPFVLYLIVATFLTIMSIIKKWSAIPVLGLLTNLYLMSELGVTNWLRFIIWMAVGLCIYFMYSYKKSKLRNSNV